MPIEYLKYNVQIMKIKTIGILIVFCLSFTACDNAMDDNFPEDYSAVLYFRESGEYNVDVSEVDGEGMVYQIYVNKGGNQPDASASASIEIQDQATLTEYNETYTLLPTEYYTVSATQLDFQSNDYYRLIEVSLKAEQISQLLDDGNRYALPILLTSESSTVNPDMCQIVLRFNK